MFSVNLSLSKARPARATRLIHNFECTAYHYTQHDQNRYKILILVLYLFFRAFFFLNIDLFFMSLVIIYFIRRAFQFAFVLI